MSKIVKQSNEISIFSDGSAYISQRKVSELLGIALSTLQNFHRSQNNDISQGLTSELFNVSVTHYAMFSRKPTNKAKQLMVKISNAGAKAFLYSLAGYKMEAKQPPAPWDKPPAQQLPMPQDYKVTLESIADEFNIQGTERIKMYATGLAQYPNLVKALPSYNSSKFVGTVGEVSERVAHAYSHHKKVHGFKLSAVAFNKELISEGLLRNEKSSSGKVFKSIVGEGLEYGKNVSPKQNSTQTQPHWYDDTIEDLYYSVAVE